MPGPRISFRFGKRATYDDKVLGTSPIAYWPMWEAEGVVARCLVNPAQNGAATGVTWGQPGIGDGKTCPLFDGTAYVNVFSPTFAAVLNGSEGSIMIWAKAFNAGVWTDGTVRYTSSLLDDSNNFIRGLQRTAANGWTRTDYKAGGTGKNVNSNGFNGRTDWIPFGQTWSKTDDEFIVYGDGAQYGVTQTGLGVWLGPIVLAVLGAFNTTPVSPWHGWLQHCAVWDRALAPTVMANLAVV